MTERYLRIGDIPAKLYEGGSTKSAVLALHGFGGSKESGAVKLLAERLCGRDFAVLAIDWQCHGERAGSFSALTPEGCEEDMMSAERWLMENVSDNLSVFATSFGGYIALRRTERGGVPFKRLALRVPAVNMADSLVSCARVTREAAGGADASLTREQQNEAELQRARACGYFDVAFGSARARVPYEFYEALVRNTVMKEIKAISDIPSSLVYAQNDELVFRTDTLRFLKLNPTVVSKMIPDCGHRMAESEEKLAQALDFSADFLSGV